MEEAYSKQASYRLCRAGLFGRVCAGLRSLCLAISTKRYFKTNIYKNVKKNDIRQINLHTLEDGALVADAFYASPGSRMSGALVTQTVEQQPLLGDADFIAACGRLLGGSSEV